MADQELVEIPWVKSREFRIISPQGATVQAVDFGDGPRVLIRLTTNWLDLGKETIQAQTDASGTTTQAGATTHDFRPIKIEEVALNIHPDVAGALIPVLLDSYSLFSSGMKKRIQDAWAKAQKA